jgi:hypothetical protein
MQVFVENQEENVGAEGMSVIMTLRCTPWSERGRLYSYLLGGIEIIGDDVYRWPPHRHPAFPWLFCSDVKGSPVDVLDTPGTDNNNAALVLNTSQAAGHCRVIATYKSPTAAQLADLGGNNIQAQGQQQNEQQEKELVSESWDFSAHSMTMPNQFFKWPGDGIVLGQENVALAKVIPKQEYAVTRHYCRRRPTEAITVLEGRINAQSVVIAGSVYPAETLRFDGANVSRRITSARGFPYYQIGYKFAVQAVYDRIETGASAYVGWNRIFRPKKGWWEKPQAVGVGIPAAQQTVYRLDTDAPSQTIRGRVVQGFDLLFHPNAS